MDQVKTGDCLNLIITESIPQQTDLPDINVKRSKMRTNFKVPAPSTWHMPKNPTEDLL